MPVAALVHGDTLVVHGGLWQSPSSPGTPGTIAELDAARRDEADPTDPSVVAALWSDPTPAGSAQFNQRRGRGLAFGPEWTREFLIKNGIHLVIRAHEGPQARSSRPDMPDMRSGYSIDHSVDSGLLVTIFSAPSPDTSCAGAFATLRPPEFAIEFTQFYSAPPRSV